jgi:hypothetical protein
MFGSQILETVTGLVFMFLAVSLATTAIQELFSSVTRLRASTLRSGLKAIMTDGSKGMALFESVVSHPVVAGAGTKPSYISAQQFTSALFYTLVENPAVPQSIATLRTAIDKTEGPMKTVLISLFRDGDQDLTSFESRLQLWFDTSMDRVSGVYKRYSQWLSFGIGALLAFMFQINAIGIVILLWSEGPLRAAVDRAMTSYLGSAGPNGSVSLDRLAPAFDLFGFSPIWSGHVSFGATWLVGCLITAVAASLGAPFWFDFLQSFVNLRSAGPVPASKSS